MIRCIAVDDEAYASDIIASFIRKIPALELVGSTTNSFEALSWVQDGKIDLVFLDIQMPELTGIQFLRICGSKCKVILTTAYPEYALEGFEHDVIDYLLKPISFERFYKAAQKAEAFFNPIQAVPEILKNLPEPKEPIVAVPEYMFIKGESKNKFLKVNYNEILYIEGLKNYVSVYTQDQRIVTYQSLRDLDAQLPQPSFFRIHKSYIVAIDKIRMVDGNTVYINEHTLPVGETYRDEFFKVIRS